MENITLFACGSIHQGILQLLMENITLFACGSIHLGNEPFGGESRGKQCAFTSLSALL